MVFFKSEKVRFDKFWTLFWHFVMSLRAILIITAKEDVDIPLFSKYFKSVEVRCKSRSGQLYVAIPPEKDFVKLLFSEIGILNGDDFNELRDLCSKDFSNPVFQLKTDSGILWPVVVMRKKNLIYCAIIFEENLMTNQQSSNMKLTFLGNVTSCLEVLNGVSNYVDYSCSSLGKLDHSGLLKYISTAFPYGRAICCNVPVALNFSSTSWKGKGKQPAWNPLPYKGKSNVTIYIKEEIRCMQFNKKEVDNLLDVYGTITCNADVEGVSPEISLILSNLSEHKFGLLVNACVTNVENVSVMSTRLRFHPVKSQILCFYKVSGALHPPIQGTFSVKVVDDVAHISVQLKLQSGVKNNFQRLEVHIPCNFVISGVRSHCSQGSLAVALKNTLVWNLGSKLPSKTLEASLQARAKLKIREKEIPSESAMTEQLQSDSDKQGLSNAANLLDAKLICASVIFMIPNYIHSSCKVDPQSIVVSSASKVNRLVSYDCFSGIYKIWSNESNENIMDDSLSEEFSTVLEIT